MMGMLVTGTSSDILKLSTDDFTLYISGSSENKKFKATNNNKNIMAHLGVDTTYNYTTETINSFKELEINNTNTMYPSFFEDGIYNLYLENNTNDKFEIYHDHKEIRDNIITRGRNTFGSFKFNGDIGYSTFRIIKNNGKYKVYEGVQLYVKDLEASTRVPNWQLRGIENVCLDAGETKRISMEVSIRDFALIRENGECVVEPGAFCIAVGGQQPDERSSELTGKKVDCFEVVLNGEITKVTY